MKPAVIDQLAGRHFVATSQNIARVTRLEAGALRVIWEQKPGEADIDEFSRFVEGILGDVNITLCTDQQREQEMLRAWRGRTGRK
jgi:hypothetical protein